MMKIVLPDYPDKHDVPKKAVSDLVTVPPSHCYFETEITHDGSLTPALSDPPCWEVDVMLHLGGLQVRVPSLGKVVNRLEMLAICMEAAPGEADAWIRNLMSDQDAQYVTRHYYNSPTHTKPRVLRA